MLNENAKAWVAALRSGKYKQGRGHLKTTAELYCCLGVACDVAIQAGLPLVVGHGERLISFDAESTVLPTAVQTWLGLQTSDGGARGLVALVTYNDQVGWSFAEIADYIESEPPGLFVETEA